MTEQEENELIAERLLRWERITSGEAAGFFFPSPSAIACDAPDFTTWASAGLILEAMARESARHARSFPFAAAIGFDPGKGDWSAGAGSKSAEAATGPLAVRAAALAYLRERK